jgi:hypothetical protein
MRSITSFGPLFISSMRVDTSAIHARDLNLIMAPSTSGTSVRFRVLIDGHSPAPSSGADIDEQGYGTVNGARMYQLIRQSGKIADREFVIEFFSSGVSVYDFTFG